MQPAADYRTLLDDPLGKYAFCERFGVWALNRELSGFVVWGRPQRQDVDSLFLPFDEPHPASMALPGDVVFDLRRVEGIDADTFDYFLEGSRARLPVFTQRIRRQAIVRPSGVLGAAAEGFAHLLAPSYGWAVFETLTSALDWSGVEAAADRARELDDLWDVATSGSPLLARLRSWVSAHGGRAAIEDAAQALGLSTRTLQRSLGDLGTSFRDEVDRARVERAKSLLLEGDLKMEAIAAKVGCATLAGFSSFFRRMTGLSPSEFRSRRR